MSEQDSFLLAHVEKTPSGYSAPEKIIGSVAAARAIFSKLRTNNLKRIDQYAQIDGLISGAPPYDPQLLKDAGLDHVSNFNDQSARALYERGCLAYWNLLHNSEHLVRFVLRGNQPELVKTADILARNWDHVIKTRWKSFGINLSSVASQIVKFGVSPVLFPDERDPRWRVVELSKFYIPDQAQSDLDLLTTVCVETEFTVQELWQIYKEFKKEPDDSSPWNLDALGSLLVYVGTTNRGKSTDRIDMLEMQKRLASGDISFENVYSDSVRLVSLFQKEYSGKISHYMFSKYTLGDKGEYEADFIFFQQDQYRCMEEALIIFTMHPGASTIHANRGLGHKFFSLAQAKIQLDCSVVDMAKWASTPIIKSSSLNSQDVEQIRFYPGVPTNIGTAEFVQNTLGANVQQVVGAAQYLASQIQFNISYSGNDSSAPDPDQGSMSPTQTRLLAFKEFSVLKNNIMHYYSTLDGLIQNMTAKMLHSKKGYPGHELMEEWKERCLEEQVPEEIFSVKDADDYFGMPRHMEVYATRAAGSGSQVSHLIGLQELQSIAGSFNKKEETEYRRQYITATVGAEFVPAFMDEAADEMDQSSSIAGLENSIMQDGKSPVFSTDNEHRAHFATHMALLMHIAKALQDRQTDPVAADKIFNVAIPHTQEHLEAAMQNPFAQSFSQQAKPAFDQINKLAILNRKNAEAMLQKQAKQETQNQEAQQQAMSEEQLKQQVTIADERRKDLKLAAQSQRQERAGAAKEQALAKKTDADIEIKTAKARADVEVQHIKNTGDVDNTRRKNEAEIALDVIHGKTISPVDFEKQG